MASVESEEERLTELLPRLNDSLFIPCLQRDYCWDRSQVEMLWDSLLRGLPLGSLLIWDAASEDIDEEPAYSFIRWYVDRQSCPRDELRRYSQRFDRDSMPEEFSLVLDGQQRLTSLYLGLTGSYTTKIHGAWVKNDSSWRDRRLYLNVLSGPGRAVEQGELVYEFDFRRSGGLSSSGETLWVPVSVLVDDAVSRPVDEVIAGLDENATFDSLDHAAPLTTESFRGLETVHERALDEVREELEADQIATAEKNLEDLYEAVNDREALLSERPVTDEKTARELFIRRNQGGEQLQGTDILLALLTGYWERFGTESRPTDAKYEIERFVSRFSQADALDGTGFAFGKSSTLRLLLLLAGERPSIRSDARYDADRLRETERIFRDDEFERSVIRAFQIADELGFHNGALTGKAAVMPIVQYLYECTDADPDSESIGRWLASVTLNGVFGDVTTRRVLEIARSHIRASGEEGFPAREILLDLEAKGADVVLNESVIEQLVEEIDYGTTTRRNVLLSQLYADRRAGTTGYEVDHIFPRNHLTDESVLRDHGVEPERVEPIRERRNHLGNLQLLAADENKRKSDISPGVWVDSFENGGPEGSADHGAYFETHHIPGRESLEYEQFERFLDERTEHLTELLVERLPRFDPHRDETTAV
jgi:hypothetical protein